MYISYERPYVCISTHTLLSNHISYVLVVATKNTYFSVYLYLGCIYLHEYAYVHGLYKDVYIHTIFMCVLVRTGRCNRYVRQETPQT